MSSLTVYSETADGWIRGYSATYATARATSSLTDATAVEITVGQALRYYIYRGFLSFDTSSLPDDAVISSATLYLTAYYDKSTTDFNILVYRYAWSETLDGSREANYDGAYGAVATLEGTFRSTVSGWAVGAEYNMAMDTTGINLTGDTKYALVSNRDVGGVTPVLFDEFVQFNSGNHATKPRLVIEYSQVVSDTQTFQWALGGIASDTQTFQWAIKNTASDTQTFQWAVKNTASDTQAFQWAIRNTASDTQTFQWALVSSCFAKTFTWSILSICSREITLQWSSGGWVSSSKDFIWGLISSVPLGRVVSLPHTTYTLEIAEVY